MGPKLAIVATHPIQYYAPWFAHLARGTGLELRVFYLWDFGVADRMDEGFGVPVRWDIPLLQGYDHEFVKNRSPWPGTDHFFGLWNPGLPRRLREFAPGAVLLTAYNYATFGLLLARWSRDGAPLIFRGDSHRLVLRSGPIGAAKRALVANVFRRFSAFLYVGSANRDYFSHHGVPDARLFHAPHAVDNSRFMGQRDEAEADARAWRRELGIAKEHRVVLFAGKFEEKKRPLDLLRAFVGANIDGASLLFVGSGPLDRELRAGAAGHRRVYVAPFQNQSLMPRVYAAADLLVLPSYGPSETWGLAVNEAMCMGRPAIVSDHVGCARDLVISGETGLVFRAGDIGALRDALQTALQDDARLKRWGEAARRRVEVFSYDKATAGLLSALEFVGTTATRPQPAA